MTARRVPHLVRSCYGNRSLARPIPAAKRAWLAVVGLGVAVVVLGGACGGAAAGEGIAGAAIKPISPAVVSGSVLGLKVGEEDVTKTVHRFERSYADRISMYSFRRDDDLLQATLQVSRFRDASRLADSRFRATLVTQIGEVKPEGLRVGPTTVQVTRGNKQKLYVWVAGRNVFVLAVRDDYTQPRDLLRQAVELKP